MLVARDVRIAAIGEPDHLVVRDFSLRVERGQWVALTGPNGAGKTSLALALAGLRQVSSGAIEFEGEDVVALRAKGRLPVAVVLEQPATQLLQPTVLEEVGFTARNLGLDEDEVRSTSRQWIGRFGLDLLAGRPPTQISAGEQQRVLLAAALTSRPRLLIADEAGVHLDPKHRALILGALREEVGLGLSLVWVSQVASELASADRVLVMGDGPGIQRIAPSPSHNQSEVTCLLVVRIHPWDGSEGPRVNTPRSLEIRIPSRGAVALRGPNGVGKSVMLSRLAGVEALRQIEVDWSAPHDFSPIHAGQYPELQIFEELVGDEVTYAARSRGVPPSEAFAAAEQHFDYLGFDGASFMRQTTFDLSAGERRATQVVGVLISPASLIVLDEPGAGLDGIKHLRLADLVRRRSREVPVVVAGQDDNWNQFIGARVVDLLP